MFQDSLENFTKKVVRQGSPGPARRLYIDYRGSRISEMYVIRIARKELLRARQASWDLDLANLVEGIVHVHAAASLWIGHLDA